MLEEVAGWASTASVCSRSRRSFVLLPATPGFTLSGFEPVRPDRIDPKVTPAPTGEVRHGTRGGRPDVRLLGGYFVFDSPDASLLVSLLPAVVHVRGVERLSPWCGSSARSRTTTRGQVAISCSRGWWRSCSSRRCARARATLPSGAPRGLADARWRQRSGRCMPSSLVRGPWRSSRRSRRSRDRHSSTASPGPWVCRRWSTCWRGEWPSPGICSAVTTFNCRDGRAGRLRFGEHLQHSLQPARGSASQSLRPRGVERRTAQASAARDLAAPQ